MKKIKQFQKRNNSFSQKIAFQKHMWQKFINYLCKNLIPQVMKKFQLENKQKRRWTRNFSYKQMLRTGPNSCPNIKEFGKPAFTHLMTMES